IVLVGASLFVRTFLNFEKARAGLPTAGLMTMRIFMVGDQYATPEAMIRRVEYIVRRIEGLPGVTSALASRMVPFNGGGSGGVALPEGSTLTKDQAPSVSYFGVT